MKLQIFCIRDRAVNAFGNPQFMLATGQAVRMFTDEVNRSDKDNLMYGHPDDYDLYFVGSFDTDSGLFETRVPEQVCVGKNVAVR